MFKIIMVAASVAAVKALEPYGHNGGGGAGAHEAYHKQDYNTEPHYSFEYQVKDLHTHDIKSHKEERKGDRTQGVYELVEPDGSKRTVEYHVDSKSGFNVVVHRQQTKHPVSNSEGSYYSSKGYSGSSSGGSSGAPSGSYSGDSSGTYGGVSSGRYSGGSSEASSGSYSGGSSGASSGRYSGGSSGVYAGENSGRYSGGSSGASSGSYSGSASEGINGGYSSSGKGGQAGSILGGSHSHGYKVHPENDYGYNQLNDGHSSFVGTEEYSSGDGVSGAVGFAGHTSGTPQNVYDSGKSSVLNQGSLIKHYTGSSGAAYGNSEYSSSASLGIYNHGGSSDEATSFASYKLHGSPHSLPGRHSEDGTYSSGLRKGPYESRSSAINLGGYVSEDTTGGNGHQDQKIQVQGYNSGETGHGYRGSSTGNSHSGSSSAGYGSSFGAYKGDGTATSSVKFSTHGANIITKTNHIIPVKHRDSPHY